MTDETATTEPLSSQLGVFGKIDNWVYRIEVVVVVTALVLMSVMVFTDVVYQLAVSIGQFADRGDSQGFIIAGAILGFIAMMAFAALGDNRPSADRDGDSRAKSMPVRVGGAIGTVVGCLAFGYAVLHLESTTIYRFLAIVGAVPVLRKLLQNGDTRRAIGFGVSIGVAWVVFGHLPTGYSWSQSYSLILLLWVAFLGASIAARERRHLRVDLSRKLMPPNKLPWFNMASYLLAAIFTALVFYLGYIYMFGSDSTYIRPIWDAPAWLPDSTRTMLMDDFPLADDASALRRMLQVFFAPTEPGELPDWLKVAAIPVSMGLICLRFLGHAIVFGRMGARGESFSEEMGAH